MVALHRIANAVDTMMSAASVASQGWNMTGDSVAACTDMVGHVSYRISDTKIPHHFHFLFLSKIGYTRVTQDHEKIETQSH